MISEEENQVADGAVVEEVHPVVRGFVKDWDAIEDLLSYVLYMNIGWEMDDEGQILFTEPLFTPKIIYLATLTGACVAGQQGCPFLSSNTSRSCSICCFNALCEAIDSGMKIKKIQD